MVPLQIDATTASIDNEIARATEVRGFLIDKRDRTVSRANLFSALVGGGLGATSAGLQLSSKQTNATAATGIAGGVEYAGRVLRASELPTSHYPRVIWDFLGEVAPSDPDRVTRRERLVRTWLELHRLDARSTTSDGIKIQRITSRPDEHLTLSIDDLEDRIAMLQDVWAKLSFLKRDLAALLGSLPAVVGLGEEDTAQR